MTTPPLTLDALIAWLEQQPPDRRFITRSATACPIGAYVNEAWEPGQLLVATTYDLKRLSGATVQEYDDELCAFVQRVHALWGHRAGVVTAAKALRIARRVKEGRP